MCSSDLPVLPTVHYNMGGIPTNYHGEVVTKRNGRLETVPGLMAIGEAACVSVHGANRLGSNSLLDLVVFGRAAAKRAAETTHAGEPHKPLPASAADPALARFDRLRNARGSKPAADIRLTMQKIMQNNCAVFRTTEVLAEGVKLIQGAAASLQDVRVSDSSLVWNSDLIEALELENLMAQAVVSMTSEIGRAHV